MREIEYPVSDTSHMELTTPSNGDEPTAVNFTVPNDTDPPHAMLTAAVTIVPDAGASTKNSAWSASPTLPPASSRVTTAPAGEHVSEMLYTKRHFFTT